MPDHPAKIREPTNFRYVGLKIASLIFVGYYLSELILSVFKLTKFTVTIGQSYGDAYKEFFPVWRILNSMFYALSFFIIAMQMMDWWNTFEGMETRKKAKRVSLAFLLTTIFTIIYELIFIYSPVVYSEQSDITIPLLSLVGSHIASIFILKQLMERFGRQFNVNSGKSVFYALFSANPFIRFAIPFIIIIFIPAVMDPYVFMFYSEIIMLYITGVIAIGFALTMFQDIRKINIARLLQEYEQSEKELNLDATEVS